MRFEPTNRLGAAARGASRPSTCGSWRCPRARRMRRCRSRCCIASAHGDPAARAQPLVARNVAPTDGCATRSGVCGALAPTSHMGASVRVPNIRKAFVGAQGVSDHGSTRLSIFRSTSSGRSAPAVLMAGILSSSPRTRLPDDRYTAFLIIPATLSNASAAAAAVATVAAVPP